MDILGVVVLALLAIPVGLLYALYRISDLSSTVQELQRQVSSLRRDAYRAEADAGGPEAAVASERPRRRPGAPETGGSRPDDPGSRPEETGSTPARPTTAAPSGRGRRPDIPAAFRTGTTGKLFDTSPTTDAPEDDGARPGDEPSADTSAEQPDGADRPQPDTSESGARERKHGSDRHEAAPGEREPAPTGLDLEAVIGRTWLLRVGLGILAIALALFARLVAPQLSPPAKVALAYTGAMAFFGFGKVFEERLAGFARPVMAGGLAFGFFVAYAAHFVPAMQAVSLPVSIVWMAASMLTVLAAAESWKSESTAVLAVILGHVSAQVSAGDADLYALVMIGFLALTALILLLRHGWIQLGLLGVAASYGAHLLWMLADRQPPVGNQGFWMSLAFLTSYYVIFLVADILWWHRDPDVGDGEDAERIVRNARALGPMNLVLYVALTTFLYLASDAMVDSIEWYYLTLGALQGALAWLYRDLNHADFVYYPVFGTVLWTLGLFAALDALVLNLVLASQALLLLLVARRTGLRVFYLLSQAMMAATFVHYVAYPPPAPAFGVLLGGLAVASVYLTKAYLEEDWYRIPLVPELHATLGGIVILRESVVYFGSLGTDRSLGLFVAGVELALTFVVLWRARPTLLFTVTAMAVGLPLGADRVGPDGIWAASVGFVITVLLLVYPGPARVDASRALDVVRHARVIGLLVLVGAFLAVEAAAPALPTYLLWMVLPVGLAAAQVGTDRFSGTEARPDWLATAMYVALGLLVVFLTGEATSAELTKPVWAWIWSAAAFGAFGIVRARGLTYSGYALLFVGALAFLRLSLLAIPGLDVASHPALATWWSAAVLASVPLAIGWGMDRHYGSVAESPERAEAGEPTAEPTRTGGPEDVEGLLSTLAPYLLGLLVVGAVAAESGSLGWIYLAPALAAVLLLAAGRRAEMPRPVMAAVLGVGLWHLHFLTLGVRATGIGSASILVLGFAVVTMFVERGAFPALETEPDRTVFGPVRTGLVLAATLTGMVAVYTSDLVGAQWTTVGWSVWGGAIMTAAFLLRSAIHRRVALAVLVVCVVRVFAVDTVGLSDTARIGAFLILGLVLVGIALLYNRYSAELKSWL